MVRPARKRTVVALERFVPAPKPMLNHGQQAQRVKIVSARADDHPADGVRIIEPPGAIQLRGALQSMQSVRRHVRHRLRGPALTTHSLVRNRPTHAQALMDGRRNLTPHRSAPMSAGLCLLDWSRHQGRRSAALDAGTSRRRPPILTLMGGELGESGLCPDDATKPCHLLAGRN
jgi:hypothetical protein